MSSIEIHGHPTPNQASILTEAAVEFLAALHRKFDARRSELLALRIERQNRVEAGELPDFLPQTAAIRAGEWTVAPIPTNLEEIGRAHV